MKTIDILKSTIPLQLTWTIVLLLITFYGQSVLPHFSATANRQLQWPNQSTLYWTNWSNWDGGHFRGIAENNYLPFQVVFFPFYPMLIKILMIFLGLNSLWSGLLISTISTTLLLVFLFKLLSLDYKQSTVENIIFLLLIFPTSFYLMAVYSEAVFLLQALASFYFARTNRWAYAFAIAGLSLITRPTGAALLLAITFEYYLPSAQKAKLNSIFLNKPLRLIIILFLTYILLALSMNIFMQNKLWDYIAIVNILINIIEVAILVLFAITFLNIIKRNLDTKRILTQGTIWLILSIVPLLGYLIFLQSTQNNPFAFIQHEQLWNRHLSFPWQAPLIYLKSLVLRGVFIPGLTGQTLLEFLFFLLAFHLFLKSLFTLRPSYTLYLGLSLLIPILSGTLVSIHRYILIAFPVFILLGNIQSPLLQRGWIMLSLTLLGLLSVLYFNSYWVS